ncbi:hypothetical protein LTS10_004376 [Elasticomyces elasticus]|nr:hypothetical protein LTS10_004376 [Elasticomyces elasticus]
MAAQPAIEITKLEGLHGITDPKINLHGLNSGVKRVNILLATAKSVDALEDAMHERHSKLRAVVDDAHKALARAASEVDRAVRALDKEAHEESVRLPSTMEDYDWYENLDLFAHPPQDVDDFAEFVFQTTYAKLEDYREGRCSQDTASVRKALQLVCALLSSNHGAFAGFRHLVWAKKELLRCDSELIATVEEVGSLSGPVDRAIEWLLKQDSDVGATKVELDKRLVFECTSIPQYFDAADARRALLEGWRDHDCSMDENVGVDGDGERYGKCWHKRNESLMLLLNQAAYREVKRNVWTATERTSPPELIEEIFDYALLVEEVPVVADLRELSARGYRQLKQEYRTRECGWWC